MRPLTQPYRGGSACITRDVDLRRDELAVFSVSLGSSGTIETGSAAAGFSAEQRCGFESELTMPSRVNCERWPTTRCAYKVGASDGAWQLSAVLAGPSEQI